MTRLFHIALTLLCLLVLASCKSVYYNTFYNAKQSYNLADQKRIESETPGSRLTPAIYRELYKRAIAKSSAVLELYPKSKWVDDSLLLIGKAFYWREEYTDALTKFQELQENFSNSALISQTIYWQGLTLWAMDRNNDARVSFSFLDEQTDPDLFGLANLALAEMEATQGNYEDAVVAYKTLLGLLGKKHKLRAQAWLGIGNNLLDLNRHDEALEAYENVLKSKPNAKTNFETRVKIGGTLERQNKFDEALAAYEKILKTKRLRIYEAEIQLKQGNVYRLKDQVEIAEEIYNEIAKKYPRSKYSADALYRLGLIEQITRKNLEKAKELFEKAAREARSSEPGQLALQRQKDLTSLERYRKRASSAKDPQQALIPLFNLAELYLFNLGETDSALVTYQKALSLADSSDLAPKARYAIAIIYADSLNNETAAREQFQVLLDQYANTPYAVEARLRLNQNRDDDALAEARFLEAESLKEEGIPARDIADIYQQIVDEYPRSLFAPQALFALAWTYENDLDQLERAKSFYEQVRDRYPQTHYGEIAMDKLKGDFLKPYEPPAPEPADTTQTALVETLPNTSDQNQTPSAPNTREQTPQKPAFKPDVVFGGGLMYAVDADQEPQLIDELEPDYPEAAREEGKPALIMVRLLVLKDGSVAKVDVLSGPDLFHSAAVDVAKKYIFEPGMHEDSLRDMWLDMSIFFELPE